MQQVANQLAEHRLDYAARAVVRAHPGTTTLHYHVHLLASDETTIAEAAVGHRELRRMLKDMVTVMPQRGAARCTVTALASRQLGCAGSAEAWRVSATHTGDVLLDLLDAGAAAAWTCARPYHAGCITRAVLDPAAFEAFFADACSVYGGQPAEIFDDMVPA